MKLAPVKVKVMSDGLIVVDGETVTLSQFQERIGRCDPAKATVWYYRENPNSSEPPAVAFKVLDIVMKQRLAISLSSKADFSDVIDDKGESHPRQ